MHQELDQDDAQDDFEEDKVLAKTTDSHRGAVREDRSRDIVCHEKRVSRGDPCPCGSGKRFGDCCYRP